MISLKFRPLPSINIFDNKLIQYKIELFIVYKVHSPLIQNVKVLSFYLDHVFGKRSGTLGPRDRFFFHHNARQ